METAVCVVYHPIVPTKADNSETQKCKLGYGILTFNGPHEPRELRGSKEAIYYLDGPGQVAQLDPAYNGLK